MLELVRDTDFRFSLNSRYFLTKYCNFFLPILPHKLNFFPILKDFPLLNSKIFSAPGGLRAFHGNVRSEFLKARPNPSGLRCWSIDWKCYSGAAT